MCASLRGTLKSHNFPGTKQHLSLQSGIKKLAWFSLHFPFSITFYLNFALELEKKSLQKMDEPYANRQVSYPHGKKNLFLNPS